MTNFTLLFLSISRSNSSDNDAELADFSDDISLQRAETHSTIHFSPDKMILVVGLKIPIFLKDQFVFRLLITLKESSRRISLKYVHYKGSGREYATIKVSQPQDTQLVSF